MNAFLATTGLIAAYILVVLGIFVVNELVIIGLEIDPGEDES